MPSLPKLSTLISLFFYLIPLYIFVGAPLLRQIFPGESPDTDDLDFDLFDDGEDSDTPSLHLSDDSFISPEDGTPLNCPGSNDYRVHMLNVEPLVIYIEEFLEGWEAEWLVDVRYVYTNILLDIIYIYQRRRKLTRNTIYQFNKLHTINSLRRRKQQNRHQQTTLRSSAPRPGLRGALHRGPRACFPGLAAAFVHRANVGAAVQHLGTLRIPL